MFPLCWAPRNNHQIQLKLIELIHFNKSIIFVTEEVVCYAVNDTDEVKMALYMVKYL